MNRRLTSILLPAVAAVLVAGCSTFDERPIASVGSDDLGQDQLDELLSVLPDATQSGDSDPSSGADVRQAIDIWVRGQLQEVALSERDVEIPADVSDQVSTQLSEQLPGFDDLTDGTRSFIVDYVAGGQALSADATSASDEFVARYDRGPDVSGLICVSHILVEDEAAAQDVEERLDDGADFADLAAELSIDTGSGAQGGSLGCFDVDTFSATFVPEFVDGALDAEIGVPSDPVRSEFGYHVILLDDGESSRAELARFEVDPRYLAETTDVRVDPRYGTFDPVTGTVVGLG